MGLSVVHVARSRVHIRTRCGRRTRDCVFVDAEVARHPIFWEEGSALRAVTSSSAAPAICVACAAAPSFRSDSD